MKEQNNSHSGYHEEKPNAKAKTIQVLLEHGADMTARDDSDSTPLHLALSMGPSEIAQLLIERGADVNVLDGSCKTPLHLASAWVSIKTA